MDNNQNQAELDPWATMGNSLSHNTGEVTEEGLEREKEWTDAMADAPEYAGPFETPELTLETPAEEGTPARDETIAAASAVLNLGLNATAREKSVGEVVEAIKYYDLEAGDNPIVPLNETVGIDTREEFQDLKDEMKVSKPKEDAYRSDVNAPTTMQRNKFAAREAIRKFKDLIREVETSPVYADLRAEALADGKSQNVFEYAAKKYNANNAATQSAAPDLIMLFHALSEEKKKYEAKKVTPEKPKEEAKKEELPEEEASKEELPKSEEEKQAEQNANPENKADTLKKQEDALFEQAA